MEMKMAETQGIIQRIENEVENQKAAMEGEEETRRRFQESQEEGARLEQELMEYREKMEELEGRREAVRLRTNQLSVRLNGFRRAEEELTRNREQLGILMNHWDALERRRREGNGAKDKADLNRMEFPGGREEDKSLAESIDMELEMIRDAKEVGFMGLFQLKEYMKGMLEGQKETADTLTGMGVA